MHTLILVGFTFFSSCSYMGNFNVKYQHLAIAKHPLCFDVVSLFKVQA